MRRARILVAGINGHVGGALAARLVKDQYEVHGLIRRDSSIHNLKERGVVPHIQFHTWENPSTWAKEFDVVIHLAAPGMRPSDSYQEIYFQHSKLLICLTENIKPSSNFKFIYAGSCFEYLDGLLLKEEDPLFPRSGYSLAKINGWNFVKGYCFTQGMKAKAICLRLFTVYGPFEAQYRVIPTLLQGALDKKIVPLTEGTQTRDFIFVDDVADAFCKALESEIAEPFSIFNISTGQETSIRALVDIIKTKMNLPLDAEFGAIPLRTREYFHLTGNPAAAREKLGWTSKTTLEQGLVQTWSWMNKNE